MAKEILQLEFWNECKENRCKFCSLTYTSPEDMVLNPDRLRTPEEKLFIIKKHLGYLPTIDWNMFDQISFQGGEIMNGYDEFWLPAYNTLIQRMMDLMQEGKLKKLYLITSMKYKYEGSLLEFTLQKFRERGFGAEHLMVGTSYDIKYRFTEETERNWWTNLGKVKRMGFNVHCTTILSQFLIEAYMSGEKRMQRILKLFPGRLFDLIGTIGNRHSTQMPPDFLPKRASFMRFCKFLMQNNFPLWERFADQSGRRATHVYRPHTDFIIWRDLKHHRGNEPEILAPCGHFIYCHSYADHDGCWACDVERLVDLEKGMKE